MKTATLLGGLALIAATFATAPALAQSADTILINGKIVTLAGSGTQEALAVRDGKVIAVGARPRSATSPGPAPRWSSLPAAP